MQPLDPDLKEGVILVIDITMILLTHGDHPFYEHLITQESIYGKYYFN